MQVDKSKRNAGFSGGQALVIGLLLIIPLMIIASVTHLIPMTRVFSSAQTDNSMMQDPEYVGMENYERMAEDRLFQQSIANTIPYVIMRMVIVALIPAVVGGLIGAQARLGRTINRVLMSLIAVLIVPVSIGLLWRVYWGQMWGREPSPVFNEMFALNSTEGAVFSLQMLDALLVTVIAAVVGGTVFIAVMRGRNRMMAGLGAGLIGVIVAGASGFLVFDLPYVITQGGPANSTSTYMLAVYNSGFRMFRIGYAAAQVSFLAIGALLTGLIIGIISIGFNLRVMPTSNHSAHGRNTLSFISVPLLLVLMLPLAGLILWGFGLGAQADVMAEANEMFDWSNAQTISMTPWFAIWFVHLPITFMAGLGLGFFRPLGKVGTNILFVILLMITIIPMEVLMFEWFILAREMELLNTPIVSGLPWVVNGFSLLVFKLLFDGAREKYITAIENGESGSNAFSRQVMLPGALMALVVGVVLCFVSINSMFWALVSQNSPDNFPTVVALLQLTMRFASENAMGTGIAVQIIWQNFLVFLVLFGVLQVFVLDRFKLEGGQQGAMSLSDDAGEDYMPVHNTYDDYRDSNTPITDTGFFDDSPSDSSSDSWSDSSSDSGSDSSSDD